MSFDPSTLYTTIAQCSATIVAILGGFIASRLISLFSDRDEINNRLKEMDEELEFKINECKDLIHQNEIEDADYFIRKNIKYVFEDDILSVLYKEQEVDYIELETLRPYWEHAKNLANELMREYESDTCEFNDDMIPTSFAETLNSADYEIVKFIIKETKKSSDKQNPLYFPIQQLIDIPPIHINDDYKQRSNQINVLEYDIAFLKLQQQQAIKKKNVYRKPKGMMSGIIILSVFSAFGIITPLILLTLEIESIFIVALAIVMFCLGLVSVVWYLADLLAWKDEVS